MTGAQDEADALLARLAEYQSCPESAEAMLSLVADCDPLSLEDMRKGPKMCLSRLYSTNLGMFAMYRDSAGRFKMTVRGVVIDTRMPDSWDVPPGEWRLGRV